MYRRSRMTDGSLKLIETARISRSYTEITSTLPWHQSVTAFCQLTIFSGSYDAFRRSVCSNLFEFCPTPVGVSIGCGLWYLRRDADTVNVTALRCSWLAIAPIVLTALSAGACASTG